MSLKFILSGLNHPKIYSFLQLNLEFDKDQNSIFQNLAVKSNFQFFDLN